MTYQTRLFVSNIPEDLTELDLRSAFSNYGDIDNINLKSKSEDENPKKFAFITLSTSSYNVESCIKHFSNELFNGSQLYVTRARESFLERLQREREQAQQKPVLKDVANEDLSKTNPVINLSEKLNPRKRINDNKTSYAEETYNNQAKISKSSRYGKHSSDIKINNTIDERTESMVTEIDEKKRISDTKRLESMKKKRTEFREKQKIIKTGLVGIDKVPNKKIIFSDEEQTEQGKSNETTKTKKQSTLFEDDDSDDEVNFKIKEQFEGKKGLKVLDLQSRYKSDKRFVLDERFINEESEEENNYEKTESEAIVMGPEDEKTKQLNILQDVLGVQIKTSAQDPAKDSKKIKSKFGMLRFDPNHPDHAKFLVPIEEKQEPTKKSKKKKSKEINNENKQEQPEPEVQKVEVSKEQFYKVSESLKEAIAKPTTFSLRSLFTKNDEDDEKEVEAQDSGFVPLQSSKETKVKNPLDPGQNNPFRYDSSDSDDEDNVKQTKDILPENPQPKAVWKENLFFTKFDDRLKEGLMFFNNYKSDGQKERRELKSLMKKRIHNSERKNQMFQKKIGGRKKTMKKRFRTKH